MTTRVTFEAGTISDALKRAARVAPAKVGSSFDKAAGIIFDVAPGTDAPCVIRATDIETFYVEVIDTNSCEGDACRWRLPSQLLAGVIGTLPGTTGKQVTFTWDGAGPVIITSGRMKVQLNLNLNTFYPEWNVVDSLQLVNAPNFGGNITRVEWAASKEGPAPLNGVLIDGTHMLATDRYKVARVPCEIDVTEPMVIPAWSIGSLMKQMGDVLVGSTGNMFVAMPDDYTQIQVVKLGGDMPPVQKITSLSYEQEVSFDRTDLLDRISRAVQFAGADRAPILSIYIGRGGLAVFMQNDDIGLFGDEIDLTGQADHKRTKILFTPRMLIDALNHAPNPKVTLKYNPSNVMIPVCIDGDSGYEAWVAPRREMKPSE